MAKTIEELLAQAETIKDETQIGQNTAERVGTLFQDISEYIDEEGQVPHTLSELQDVNISGVVTGKYLQFNGTKWMGADGAADGKDGKDGRGVDYIIYYYRAVQSTYYKPGQNQQPDIDANDKTLVESTGWGVDKPYLYKKPLTRFTDDSEYWGMTQLDSVWLDTGEEPEYSFSLIVNPEYAIFEEPIDQDNPQIDPTDGSIIYGPGEVDTSDWSSRVKVLKAKEPQIIKYTELVCRNCTATVSGNGTTELTVFVDSVNSDSGATDGSISFSVAIRNESDGIYYKFFDVTIPIYINRVGSRYQVISGDVEKTIMSKVVYDDGGGDVIRFDNLGEYIRSSELNMSRITSDIDNLSGDVTTLSSEFTQTAEGFELKVSSLSADVESISSQYSTIEQTVNRISLNVSTVSGDVESLSGSVDSVSGSVDSMGTKLISTGIDTEQGQITLKADKVTFTNSDGSVSGKVSINPTTGTLNAVDGEFEGDITAKSLRTSILDVTGGVDSSNPTVIPLSTNPAGSYHLKGGGYFTLPKAWDFIGLQVTLFISSGVNWEPAYINSSGRLEQPNTAFHLLGYKKSDMTTLGMFFDDIQCSTCALTLLSTSIYDTNDSSWEIMSQRGSITCGGNGGNVVYPDGCFVDL